MVKDHFSKAHNRVKQLANKKRYDGAFVVEPTTIQTDDNIFKECSEDGSKVLLAILDP